ncbi:MAG: PilZ domain-containing protein [Pseudomonadota bacterium]|nr:PilZ domain-containing protein [Pseudomonadota bacterium]
MDQGEYLFDVMDIVAHIFFAVGTTDEVRVTSPGGAFVGTFVYPEGDEVFIQFHGAAPALAPGMTLYVEYEGPGDSYRFHSEVVTCDAERVQVRLPQAVECSDRRLTQRVGVAADAGYWFVVDGAGAEQTFAVLDLSDGGVGFLNAEGARLRVGDTLTGSLHLPGGGPLRVSLEVRHLRVQDGRRHVGARFVSISLVDRGQLARFLVALAA